MCGGREIHGAIWWGNTKERDYTEDLDIYVRIILRVILDKYDERRWTGLIWLLIGTNGGLF